MLPNKVEYGGKTLIDLTGDTVTAEKLLRGVTAHDKTGKMIIGTNLGPKPEHQGAVTIHENGTTRYTPNPGKVFSAFQVTVDTPVPPPIQNKSARATANGTTVVRADPGTVMESVSVDVSVPSYTAATVTIKHEGKAINCWYTDTTGNVKTLKIPYEFPSNAHNITTVLKGIITFEGDNNNASMSIYSPLGVTKLYAHGPGGAVSVVRTSASFEIINDR